MALSHIRAAMRLPMTAAYRTLVAKQTTRAFSVLPDATSFSRLYDYYDSTLRHDMLVLTYKHEVSEPDAKAKAEEQTASSQATDQPSETKTEEQSAATEEVSNTLDQSMEIEPIKRNAAYTIDQLPKRRGVRPPRPARRPLTYGHQPKLERIILHCMPSAVLPVYNQRRYMHALMQHPGIYVKVYQSDVK
jgi:hypothetical protein